MAQFSLSKNPVERQNIIMGPSKRVLSKNAQGKAINIHEKPDWLAEAILAQYTKPGQWIVVGGFGAGGEVRGALNAGLNVVAIENDTGPVWPHRVQPALLRPLRQLGHGPHPSTPRVWLHAHGLP